MDPAPGPKHLPNLTAFGHDMPSQSGLAARASPVSQSSKLSTSRSRLGIQKTNFSNVLHKHADAAPPALSNCSLEEGINTPLRLALARLTMKRLIFARMDRGDKKADIERSTGLSHECIKEYRRMWRVEGNHPRSQHKRKMKTSTRTLPPLISRNERPSRKRKQRECDDHGDSSEIGILQVSKRRRKYEARDQPDVGSRHAGTKISGAGGGKCAGKQTGGSSPSMGKENVPEGDETMWTVGKTTILPFHTLGRGGT